MWLGWGGVEFGFWSQSQELTPQKLSASFLLGPSHLHLLDMWVRALVLLIADCCLAGATATHTKTVRRLRRQINLQGCSLFPLPSLSTLHINIFGNTKKIWKKIRWPPRVCVWQVWKEGSEGATVLKLKKKKKKKNLWELRRQQCCCYVTSAELKACQAACPTERKRLRRAKRRRGREVKWRKCRSERKHLYTWFNHVHFQG